MVRNPSEMQRIHEEFVEQRNKEYEKLQESRNTVALSKEMAEVRALISNNSWSKSDKVRLLDRLRKIEKQLGSEGTNYNSSEF